MLLACSALSPVAAVADDLPKRPEEIRFSALTFEAPKAAQFRHTLKNGVVVYLAPSTEFPLININFSFRGGSFLDPADKIGLASATGSMLDRGGTDSLTPAELDEKLDFLAANVGMRGGDVDSNASLNCLKSNFDEAFGLFMDILRRPRFDQERFDLWKAEVLEGMKQRNDRPEPILRREWQALLYGREHFSARPTTKASIDSLTVNDLRTMHARIFNPSNLIVAVTGDFENSQMLAKLEKAFEGWEKGEKIGDPPAPTATFTPGVYRVEKAVPQGTVNIGLRAIKRDDPDYFPMLVMNEILGGGGFTSRITTKVRSNEGLAYSAGSGFVPNVYYPGEFRASFGSKNPTVALSAKIILDEITQIRNQPVTDGELDVAKNSFIETFPRTFESKPGMLAVFVNDERTHRPADFWQTYRDKVKAVTAADVQRVAKKYLTPEQMAVLVVGNWSEIAVGDGNKRASMADIFGGQSTSLPLRDPLTMEPIPAP
jgi:zinc protease